MSDIVVLKGPANVSERQVVDVLIEVFVRLGDVVAVLLEHPVFGLVIDV